MPSCFSCFGGSRKSNPSVDDSCADNENCEMHTALERNSYGSFITCDAVDETNIASPVLDSLLPEVIQRGRENMELMIDMMVNKAGFVANGKIGETSLWYINRSSTGIPPIALGEILFPLYDVAELGKVIMDLDNKGKWDSEFLKGEVISKVVISDEAVYRKTWAAMKPKAGVAGRDFVYHTLTRTTSDSFCVVSWSVDDLDVPPEYVSRSSGHVRGRIFLAGFLVRRMTSQNTLTVNYLNHVNVGISGWLSDPVVKRTPQVLNGLRKYISS